MPKIDTIRRIIRVGASAALTITVGLAVLGCSGNTGSLPPATITFQVATSVTPDEATANHSVVVVLSIVGTLTADLTVDVANTGGSANAGADYTAVAATLTFPAGSGNGTTRMVNIPVLADTLIEGNESVILTLSNVSVNGSLGAQTTHTTTITDDDAPASPANIATVAGNGTGGFGGDGAAATAARLNQPTGVAIDTDGNWLIADRTNNRIRRVDAITGFVTTVAGTGTAGFSGDGGAATAAQLDAPSGVAIDAAGTLLIADRNNHRIRRVDAITGVMTTVAGNGTAGFGGDGAAATAAQLNQPFGVAIDAAGNLLIADLSNNRIRKVNVLTGFITTVAGDGTAGFSGDGGAATAARVNAPTGVGLDTAGNLLIADRSNQRVRRVDAITGVITTVAGNGTVGSGGDGAAATAAQLNAPTGVATDAANNLLIADESNHRIRRVDAITGFISTVAGTGTAGFSGDGGAATSAQLNFPASVAVDASGNLLLADTFNHRIRRVDNLSPLAVQTTILAFAPLSAAYSQPIRATGGSGSGYTWSVLAGTLPTGLTLANGTPDATLSGTPTAVGSFGFTLQVQDAQGHTDAEAFTLTVADPVITTTVGTGTGGFSGDGAAATAAMLNSPADIVVDTAGNLLIADQTNHRIRRVDAFTGFITTVAGTGTPGFLGDGGAATSAQLNVPYGVAIDLAGNLLIADRGNHRIRRVDAVTGIITTVAGTGFAGFTGDGGAATAAQLNFPHGVATDAAGNLLFADQGNHRIRRVIAVTGVITTVAGTGTPGFLGDGGAATSARLNIAQGITVDAAGNLLIADSANHRIRRVDAVTGFISTVAGNGTGAFAGDSGVATAAQVFNPRGVAVDAAENLLIADQFNHRIRRVGQ